MLNRRAFLITGAGAAVGAQAATGDKMRFAMSGHEFRHTPPHPEEGIRMTARYGYHGLEPFQEDIAKYLDKPPEELKKVLDASGLALATVGSGGQYWTPPGFPRRSRVMQRGRATLLISAASTSRSISAAARTTARKT